MMRYCKTILSLILCAAMLSSLAGCKSFRRSRANNTTLTVGVGEITGEFHPLYAESEGDRAVVSQAFRSVQRRTADNKLVNDCGGISYAFVGESKVQYTVTIKDDLKFSDGTPVTIRDIIFFYHLIADASYDGVYSDFYLNDIDGVKAYYYDDPGYEKALQKIEDQVHERYIKSVITQADLATYLEKTNIAGLFAGADSPSPYGMSWGEWIQKNDGKPAGKDEAALLKRIAKAEAEVHWDQYDAADWYRRSLTDAYIKNSYKDKKSVSEISGIRKINDYTCTVLFNSRDINAVSALNAVLISEKFYAVNYVKGEAEKVHERGAFGVGCGAYQLTDHNGNTVKMTASDYVDETPAFTSLKLIDYAAAGMDPIDAVASGKLDVVTAEAAADSADRLANQPVRFFLNHSPFFTTLWLNSKTMEPMLRRAVIGLSSPSDVLQSRYGAYYTTLYRPLSIRFSEYPASVSEPSYNESAMTAYEMIANAENGTPVQSLTAAYRAEEPQDAELLQPLAAKLQQHGITLAVIPIPAAGIPYAVSSGKVDLWIDTVADGATCDQYQFFNSNGKQNLTGVEDEMLDALSSALRSGVGSSERDIMTAALLEQVMEIAIEAPICQTQRITVYNTETIDAASIPPDALNYDGFAYVIPQLKQT